MYRLSNVRKTSKEIIKLIREDSSYNKIVKNINDEFSNECTDTEKIKMLKHMIAYSEYHIVDFHIYISYFALVFAIISIIYDIPAITYKVDEKLSFWGKSYIYSGEIIIILTVFFIIFALICIFKKNQTNKNYFILKTIASDMVEKLEKLSV